MYYPSFGMVRKPKSEEYQFNKKVLHIMSIFQDHQIIGEKSCKI